MHYPKSVIWQTPGHDSSGSMPLGNGDIGLNVWVEAGGDLLFYLGKTDAWDENARLLKLGRIRISLSPNPFVAGLPFRQELDPLTGSIAIHAGREPHSIDIRVWVDANRPVVRVEITAPNPTTATAEVELWRTHLRHREGDEGHCSAGLRDEQARESVYPDTVIPMPDNTLAWCHHNRTSCWAATLEHQDMAGWIPRGHDPLMNRIFGAILRGDGLEKDTNTRLRTTTPRNRIVISIHPLTTHPTDLESWRQAVLKKAAQSDACSLESAFSEHLAWWKAFWERSWIHVSGTPEAETVTQGYNLQRFINACGGRGAYPIKFNGSIFTVDAIENGKSMDADYRRWGGGYWFQNTRLTYWAMIMSGDFDLMEPWFRMYLDALPFAMARVRACFNIDQAAMFPETMTFWGAFLNSNYGYNRGDLAPGLSQNTYIRRYWQGMLELITILLDAYSVSGDESLLQEKILVLAPPFLRFYRDYYPRRDDDGKILFTPSQALETWHRAVNPAPDIAGLHGVLNGLLALPENSISAELRTEWTEFRDLLPPIPTRSYYRKRKEVLPALQYDDCQNSENVALYTVFPYRCFGVGKPELEVGRTTWDARPVKGTDGWRQDAIQAAMLGLTDEAKASVISNFSTPHEGSRFPAFWGPNFDWIPDQDHGSVACIALQRMLMQFDNGTINLLPAWPADWTAEFRLHAPDHTVVEGKVHNGKLTDVHVTPESRQADIIP